MLQTLQSTADTREMALLARGQVEQSPEQFRGAALNAAREAMALAAKGQLNGQDVAPLFEVFQRYGDASVVADLERLGGRWNYYSAMALAQLPDGAGIPTLIQWATDPNDPLKVNKGTALSVLAQVAMQYPDVLNALMEQARLNQIPPGTWVSVAYALAGDQYQFINQGPGHDVEPPGYSGAAKLPHRAAQTASTVTPLVPRKN